jgi:glycosyltransferase involved in cell wall biosynthesis
MIKVLFANTHYPDRYNLWAPWNKLANIAVSKSRAIEPEVIVPRAYTLPLKFFPQHETCGLPATERSVEGLVHYPRFLYLLPKKYFYAASFDLYSYFVGKYVRSHIGRKDLVHAHHVFLDGYGMVETCKKWEAPLIVDVHGDSVFTQMVRDPLIGRKMAHTLKYASKVVCISRNLCQLAKSFGIDEDRIEYVPLGIDIGKYRPEEQERIKGGRGLQDKIVILYVGQLIERKGVDHLIRALARIDRPLLRRCKVVIAGQGPEREMLEKLAVELDVNDYVSFVGKVSQADLRRWYAAADIFVLPSLSEGRPTVINKAMASECAIVASAVSGIPEQVDDGRNGFLVPPADPAALAVKLQYLIENEAQTAAMGRNSRKKIVAEKLTWEGYADRIVKIYGGLAGT